MTYICVKPRELDYFVGDPEGFFYGVGFTKLEVCFPRLFYCKVKVAGSFDIQIRK